MPSQKRVATRFTPDTLTYRTSDGGNTALRGSRHAIVEATQDKWYSASYRMQVADTDDWLGRCSDLFHTIDRITGIGLDVKVAWDLIPFSFLADWFANTGDFLENRTVISDYNIACEYGYAMCHTQFQKTMIAEGYYVQYPAGSSIPGSSASLSYSLLSETKQRSACSSFGFYTDFAKLNSYQWSALTALGVVFASGQTPRARL